MKIHSKALACVVLCLLMNHISGKIWTKVDEEALITNLDLDEFEFEDMCSAEVTVNVWSRVTAGKDPGFDVLELFAASQRERAEANAGHRRDEYPERTADVERKLDLDSKPGDVMLPAEKYKQLLKFSGDVSQAINERRVACQTSINCSLTSDDPSQLLAAWKQLSFANSSSADIRHRYSDTLMLVRDAAEANGSPDAESYWLMLSDLEQDGYRRAKTLWAEVRPLYQKLHRWMAKNLLKKYGSAVFPETDKKNKNPATGIPAHLLGSQLGADWSNIADVVLSTECSQVYHHIVSSLNAKKVVGKSLYQMAEKMTHFLRVGKLDASFWEDSVFESSCPARFVNPCRKEPRVAACNTSSWSDYLDGHENTMRTVHTQLTTSSPQDLTYFLKNGNRFSAVDEGVAGLATLIASNRHYLAQQELLQLPKNGCVKDALYILVALKVLPRLPYYLVADLARLEAVKTNRTADIGKIWSEMRADDSMQGVTSPDGEWWGFLEDPHIAANKPYISHFYGVLVQFHLFGELLMSDESTSGDAEEFIRSRDEFKLLLELGMSKKWPQLLNDTFGITSIQSHFLLRYFDRLDALITPLLPKDSRISSNPAPTPAAKVTPPLEPVTEDNLNITLSDASGILRSNATTDTSSEKDPPGVGHYLLIACAVAVAIALVVVVVSYGRKCLKKKHNYQRPVNQPA